VPTIRDGSQPPTPILKIQRPHIYVFEDKVPNETKMKDVRPNRKWEVQYDDLFTYVYKPEIPISKPIDKKGTRCQLLYSLILFSGFNYSMKLIIIKPILSTKRSGQFKIINQLQPYTFLGSIANQYIFLIELVSSVLNE